MNNNNNNKNISINDITLSSSIISNIPTRITLKSENLEFEFLFQPLDSILLIEAKDKPYGRKSYVSQMNLRNFKNNELFKYFIFYDNLSDIKEEIIRIINEKKYKINEKNEQLILILYSKIENKELKNEIINIILENKNKKNQKKNLKNKKKENKFFNSNEENNFKNSLNKININNNNNSEIFTNNNIINNNEINEENKSIINLNIHNIKNDNFKNEYFLNILNEQNKKLFLLENKIKNLENNIEELQIENQKLNEKIENKNINEQIISDNIITNNDDDFNYENKNNNNLIIENMKMITLPGKNINHCLILNENKICINIDSIILIFDINSNKILESINEKKNIKNLINISNYLILNYKKTSNIIVYKLNKNEIKFVQKINEFNSNQIISFDDETFISCSNEKVILFYKLNNKMNFCVDLKLVGHQNSINCICKISNNKIVSFSQNEKKLYFWNIKDKNYSKFIEELININNIYYINENYILLIGDSFIYIIDINNKNLLKNILNIKNPITSFLNLQNNNFLLGDLKGYLYCIYYYKNNFEITKRIRLYQAILNNIVKKDENIIVTSNSIENILIFKYEYLKNE